MTAYDEIRDAVMRMRATAEAATTGSRWRNMRGAQMGESVVAGAAVIAQMHGRDQRENRRHMASWDPQVAIAVADMLDCVARWSVPDEPEFGAALVVARAYMDRVG